MPDTAPVPQADEDAADSAMQADAQEGVHPLPTRGDAAAGPHRPPGGRVSADGANLRRMLDVPLSLTVELGSTEMPLAEVLRLETGAVVTIDRLPGEPIDLLINGRLFARGEVVVISETFGFRITELVGDTDDGPQTAHTEGDRL